MSLLHRLAILWPLLLGAAASGASDVLDHGFAGTGVSVFTALGDQTRVFGSCPHPDGSASIVAHRDVPREWVIARIRADGTLDPSFSDDGYTTIPTSSPVLDWPVQAACTGMGNTDPNDDAMVVAADSKVSYVMAAHLLMLKFDLHQGAVAWSALHNINAMMMGYDPETGETDWNGLLIHGLFPGNNGDWLVMGAVTQGEANQLGYLVRTNASGTVSAWNTFEPEQGTSFPEIHAARIVNDAEGYALARIQTAQGSNWGVLRFAASHLGYAGLVAQGGAATANGSLFKGRFIGGIGFVAPVLAPNPQPAGPALPRLLVVRGSNVADVALPAPGPIRGVASGMQPALSATVAANGRVIVGGGLWAGSLPAAGYYTAMVKLGNGDTLADAIDTSYGQQGSAVFHFNPPAADNHCVGTDVPAQHFSNISSWGNATLLVGNAAPNCYDEANNEFGTSSWVLAARIQSDTSIIFANGFD